MGIIIDLVINAIGKTKKVEPEEAVGHMCEHDHCDCEHGIFKSALKHTINIFIFITIITFAINTLIHFIGEETIEILKNDPKKLLRVCQYLEYLYLQYLG